MLKISSPFNFAKITLDCFKFGFISITFCSSFILTIWTYLCVKSFINILDNGRYLTTLLEKNKLIKPLFNTKLFTMNIETAYTKIYQKYVQEDL